MFSEFVLDPISVKYLSSTVTQWYNPEAEVDFPGVLNETEIPIFYLDSLWNITVSQSTTVVHSVPFEI